MYDNDLAYIQATAFDNPARGSAPEVIRRLNSAAIPIKHVVDLGCGSGPLTLALVRAGFGVTAIDQSAELLSIAQQAAPSARCIHASIYETELPECEAVLAVGEPLTYHAPEAEADRLLRRLFQQAASVVPPHGILIFDVIETGKPSLSGRFWSAGDDWAVMVETTENQPTRQLVRDIQTFRKVGEL